MVGQKAGNRNSKLSSRLAARSRLPPWVYPAAPHGYRAFRSLYCGGAFSLIVREPKSRQPPHRELNSTQPLPLTLNPFLHTHACIRKTCSVVGAPLRSSFACFVFFVRSGRARALPKTQAGDHDPSSFYPSFQLDCLRQPYGGSPGATSASRGSPTSTTMDDDDEEAEDRRHHASLRSMGSDGDGDDDDAHGAPSPCPARLEMDDDGFGGGGGGGGRRDGVMGRISAALEEAGGDRDRDGAKGVPETPLRRPGSGAASRVLERAAGRGGGDGSCSPVGGYAGLDRWGGWGVEQSDLLLLYLVGQRQLFNRARTYVEGMYCSDIGCAT